MLRIQRNKRIGRVVFLVEGDKDEPALLTLLFHDILGYAVDVYDKRSKEVRSFPGLDPFSHVYVVPMPSSSIANIPGDDAFFDSMYQTLKDYGLERTEAATYYLFDRDRQSNKPVAVERAISLLCNPYENGVERGGALLLSYPCIQAYYCQAHGHQTNFRQSKKAKHYVAEHHLATLEEWSVVFAASAMTSIVEEYKGSPISPLDYEDYRSINEPIYREMESRFEENGYSVLSLLSLALLDFGILVEA